MAEEKLRYIFELVKSEFERGAKGIYDNLRGIDKQADKTGDTLKKIGDEANKGAGKASDGLGKLKTESDKAARSIDSLEREISQLRDKIKLEVNFSEIQKAKKEIDNLEKEIQSIEKKGGLKPSPTPAGLGGMGDTLLKRAGAIGAGFFAAEKLLDVGKQIFDITAQTQTFRAVLTNTLGNGGVADDAMMMIQAFAAKTPFAVTELTDSFVKLANRGFVPTQVELRKLGDLASSTGKPFDQLVEAVLDAQTGEFERLKEFGIKAKKEGDNVTFTFKGQTQTVKNTEKAIRDYILTLGDMQGVSGSMAAISETLSGKVSNLGDSWDMLLNTLGGGKTSSIFGAVIGNMSNLISKLNDSIDPITAARKKLKIDIDESDNLTNKVAPKIGEYEKLLDKMNAKNAKITDEQRKNFMIVANQIATEIPNAVQGYEEITIGAEKYIKAIIDTAAAYKIIADKNKSTGESKIKTIGELDAEILDLQNQNEKINSLRKIGKVAVKSARNDRVLELPMTEDLKLAQNKEQKRILDKIAELERQKQNLLGLQTEPEPNLPPPLSTGGSASGSSASGSSIGGSGNGGNRNITQNINRIDINVNVADSSEAPEKTAIALKEVLLQELRNVQNIY